MKKCKYLRSEFEIRLNESEIENLKLGYEVPILMLVHGREPEKKGGLIRKIEVEITCRKIGYQCDFCGKTYDDKHVRIVTTEDTGEENTVCDICYVPLVS